MTEEMVELLISEQLDLRLDDIDSRINGQMNAMKEELEAQMAKLGERSETDSEDEKEKINLMIDLKLNAAIEEMEERMRSEVEDIQKKVVKMQLSVKLTSMMQKTNAIKPGDLAAQKKARRDRESKITEFKNLRSQVNSGEM